MYSGIDINYISKKIDGMLEEFHSDGDKEGLKTGLFCLCSNVCFDIRNKFLNRYGELLGDLDGWKTVLPEDSEMYKRLEKIENQEF